MAEAKEQNTQIELAGGQAVQMMTVNDFRFTDIPVPEPKEGEVLLKSRYVSVDPYLRGRFMAMPVGSVPVSGAVAEVVESKSELFQKGDLVLSYFPWAKFFVAGEKNVTKLSGDLSPSTYLGVAGMTGRTAYIGLGPAGCDLKDTDKTLVVSGAAGAVGSIVAQIAKLRVPNLRVVGFAGSDDKLDFLKEIGYDVALNYKNYPDTASLVAALKDACPNGVDCYFDNTGGPITDAVFDVLNKFARVAVCGQIAMYNDPRASNPAFLYKVIYKCVTIRGFAQGEFADQFPAFNRDMRAWLAEGKIKGREHVVQGFAKIPEAFLGLFTGANIGKMIVDVCPAPMPNILVSVKWD